MTTEKIHNRQLVFMLFMIRSTVTIATLPVLTTGAAGQDAWLSAISAWPRPPQSCSSAAWRLNFPKKPSSNTAGNCWARPAAP